MFKVLVCTSEALPLNFTSILTQCQVVTANEYFDDPCLLQQADIYKQPLAVGYKEWPIFDLVKNNIRI